MTRLGLTRSRAVAVAMPLAILALAAGCGAAEDAGPSGEPASADPGSPAPGPGDVVQADRAAGTLVPTPDVVAPGDVLTVRVDNQGEVRLDYGLANRVDRFADGDWTDVTAEAYEGRGPPAFAEILLTLGPGKRGAPEEIALSENLEPGTYRVAKDVFAQGGSARDRLELEAVFEVRA
jgi:hypothetical protein